MKEISLNRENGRLVVTVSWRFKLPKCCTVCPAMTSFRGTNSLSCGVGSFEFLSEVVFRVLNLDKLRHQDCKIDSMLREANAPEAQAETAVADMLGG